MRFISTLFISLLLFFSLLAPNLSHANNILDDLMGIGGPRSSSRNKLKISKKKKKEELKDKVTLSSKNMKLSTIKKPLTYGK